MNEVGYNTQVVKIQCCEKENLLESVTSNFHNIGSTLFLPDDC